MSEARFEPSAEFASALDAKDPLRGYRDRFHIPKAADGTECIYLAGNSLGLQPKKVREYVAEDLDDWAKYGVEGHLHAKHPWLPYHENLTEMTARLVGARPIEVVTMNTLTVNLHLMMVSFYRPTSSRFKILVEGGAFPSDQYAVASQARYHGYDPAVAIVELRPRAGEDTLRTEDILERIHKEGDSIALVLIGNVNYLTGQAFDMAAITKAAQSKGCRVGFDLAHGAGNLVLNLHDVGADFAVWCSYKYLNSGPGALAGCFVHERHSKDGTLPRFAGWWGHDKKTRFQMGPDFKPIPGAEGWQLSNPPILQLAAMRASLEIFDSATIGALRAKSELLTGYLEFLLRRIQSAKFKIVTPANPSERGSQLSLKVSDGAAELAKKLIAGGVFCDFREPDIIRVAPTALYNRFSEAFRVAELMAGHLEHRP